MAVFETNKTVLQPQHGPHKTSGDLFNYQVALCLNDGRRGYGLPPSETCEYIGAIAVVIHPPRLTEMTRTEAAPRRGARQNPATTPVATDGRAPGP